AINVGKLYNPASRPRTVDSSRSVEPLDSMVIGARTAHRLFMALPLPYEWFASHSSQERVVTSADKKAGMTCDDSTDKYWRWHSGFSSARRRRRQLPSRAASGSAEPLRLSRIGQR